MVVECRMKVSEDFAFIIAIKANECINIHVACELDALYRNKRFVVSTKFYGNNKSEWAMLLSGWNK